MLRRTAIRAERVYREIEEAGCLTSAAIAERLRIPHSELFYVLNTLRREGRVETVNLGRVALWCADRAAAEEVSSRLAEALRGLLCGRRFATPKEALRLAAEDRETRKLFSRHVPLRPNPATMQVVDALMAKAFGEPIKTARGRIYHIRCAEKSTATGPRGRAPMYGRLRRIDSTTQDPSKEVW